MSLDQRDPLSESWTLEVSKADYDQLCQQLWPAVQHDKTSIYVLNESVNRTIAIDLIDCQNNFAQFILRYPIQLDQLKLADKDHCTVLIRQVRILQFLEHKAPHLKAPRVVYYDGTRANPIRTPFMIQNRIQGQPLSEVLLNLTLKQRMDIATAIGRFYEGQRRVNMPRTGHVVASGEVAELDNSNDYIAIQPLGMSNMEEMRAAVELAIAEDRYVYPIKEDEDLVTYEVVNFPFQRREMSVLYRTADPEALQLAKFQQVRGIVHLMADLGDFVSEDNKIVSLWHTDLFPRNIIVDLTQRGTDIVSGIVDWDAPLFVPGFMASVPPAWLWAPYTYTHGVGDFIGTFGWDDIEPDTPELQEVKYAFLDEIDYFFTRTANNRPLAAARIFLDYAQFRDWRDHPLYHCRDTFTDWVMAKYISDNRDRLTSRGW